MPAELFPRASFLERLFDPFGGKRIRRLEEQVQRLDVDLTGLHERVSGLNADLAGLKETMARAGGFESFAPRSGKTVTDLVAGLRDEAAGLFALPEMRPEAAGPRVVVEGLDVEIRGDLDLTDGVGLRAYSADKASAQAASTIRFTLRPEVRIATPTDEDDQI